MDELKELRWKNILVKVGWFFFAYGQCLFQSGLVYITIVGIDTKLLDTNPISFVCLLSSYLLSDK